MCSFLKIPLSVREFTKSFITRDKDFVTDVCSSLILLMNFTSGILEFRRVSLRYSHNFYTRNKLRCYIDVTVISRIIQYNVILLKSSQLIPNCEVNKYYNSVCSLVNQIVESQQSVTRSYKNKTNNGLILILSRLPFVKVDTSL